MKVLFSPRIQQYFRDLGDILFEKEYFGFENSAILYLRTLIFEIRDTLPNRPKRLAPKYFDRYGKSMYYSIYKKSKATQWYVFFTTYEDNGEIIFPVRYISINHVISKYL